MEDLAATIASVVVVLGLIALVGMITTGAAIIVAALIGWVLCWIDEKTDKR